MYLDALEKASGGKPQKCSKCNVSNNKLRMALHNWVIFVTVISFHVPTADSEDSSQSGHETPGSESALQGTAELEDVESSDSKTKKGKKKKEKKKKVKAKGKDKKKENESQEKKAKKKGFGAMLRYFFFGFSVYDLI